MYKTILKQIAGLQIILGGVMLLPCFFAVIYREWYSLAGFLFSGLLASGTGYLVHRFLRSAGEPEYKHALVISACGWLMIMVAGALPYIIIAYITPYEIMQQFVPPGFDYPSSLLNFKNPLHAIFESTSAFTTTGLTMAYHEPSIGKSLLFYRHLSQWVGGAGFIVMSLAIFRPLPGQGSVLMYGTETAGEKLKTNVIETAKAIWKVYVLITVVMIFYLIAGTYFILPEYPLSENIFNAINHAMAGQSTGGFSTLDDSIAGYQSAGMDLLHILPMVLGSFSLPFFFRLIYQRRLSEFWHDIQARSILVAMLVGSAILSLLLIHAGIVPAPVREGVFQFVSALSTTGWQTSNIAAWDDISILFIVMSAMVVGGSAGGTVGGIKVIRAVLLQKGLAWQISKVFLSKNAIKSVKFDGKILLAEDMNRELAKAGVFVIIYLIFIFISTLITLFFMEGDYSLSDAIFEAASAQGTVGLSTGITDPGMSPVLETTYIIQMWAGRLEIIPILVLFRVLLKGTKPKII